MPRPQKKTSKGPALRNAPLPHSAPVSHDDVAREAFKIYLSRNGAPGDPIADWFEAERTVKNRIATPAASARKGLLRAKSAQAGAGSGNGRSVRRRRR